MNTANRSIDTTAELFSDGTAIELLRQRQLLALNPEGERLAPAIEYLGTTFRPALLDPELEAALALPCATAEYSSTESLVQSLRASARDDLGAGDDVALLLAATLLSTWVPECLDSGAIVNFWGAEHEQPRVLAYLAALCRRPLRLADVSLARLVELPRGLCPTILLTNPTDATVRRLLTAAGPGGGQLLHKGRLLTARCCLFVFTIQPSANINFRIALSTLDAGRCTPQDVHELTEEFQGQLLRYRLVRHQAIANSRFRTAGLSPNISGVAQVLGAVVEGADNIQSEIITALQGLEESRKAESCETQEAIAIEAALVPCHEGKPSALISELTEIANAILVARGERPLFTPRLFAGTLRRLELPTIRQARGFELPLDTWTCRRIHKLGQVLGVLSLLKPVAGCTYCSSTPETEAGSPA